MFRERRSTKQATVQMVQYSADTNPVITTTTLKSLKDPAAQNIMIEDQLSIRSQRYLNLDLKFAQKHF